jgi:putative flippase GtrA
MDNIFMMGLKYALFALISIVVNVIIQHLSFIFYDGFGELYVAMTFGTTGGLMCKYFLDKNYIFHRKESNNQNNVTEFLFYASTGVLTTLVFWTTEISFNVTFGGHEATYLGAFIGLTIGYTMKFFLDRKYVFKVKQHEFE